MELLIGCGHSRTKRIASGLPVWEKLVTLDINPDAKPDVLCDLEQIELPFKDSIFDELHAYEVLEHVGKQGDWRFFFKQFDEFARVLKPGGHLIATSPPYSSFWVWGDPGHTRYMGPEVYTFLIREEYEKQIGKSAMTDYRRYFTSNWQAVGHVATPSGVILKNIK